MMAVEVQSMIKPLLNYNDLLYNAIKLRNMEISLHYYAKLVSKGTFSV
jgi:hypothetical protein